MLSYLLADLSLLSTGSLTRQLSPLTHSVAPVPLFFYVLFVSLTPALYVKTGVKSTTPLYLMSAIYVISLLMVLSSNLYLFIFFYELIILPIFFILRGYGNYYRRVQASFFILIWALVGSIFLFIGLFIYARQGSNSFLVVSPGTSQDLKLASIALFLGFLVKVPLWPSHY